MANPLYGQSDSFYTAVLTGIGAPVNATNLAVMRAWSLAEGSVRHYNPWNSGEKYPGADYSNGPYPNYPNAEAGAAAMVKNLTGVGGAYNRVIAGFRASNPAATISAIVNSPWAGGHYLAQKQQGGTFNSQSSSLYKIWASHSGAAAVPTTPAPAAQKYVLPPGLTSGTGTLGTAQYDPIKKTLNVNGTIYSPYTDWIRQTDAQTRAGTRILILGNAGAFGFPSTVAPTTPRLQYNGYAGAIATQLGQVPGQVAGAVGQAAGAVGGYASAFLAPLAWLTSHATAIGIVLLGVFVILIAVLLANKATVGKVATVAALA